MGNVGNFLTGIVTFEGTGTAIPVEVNISSVQMASCMRPQRFLKSEDFSLIKKTPRMTIESFNKQYKYKKPMNCGKYERLFEIQWISPPGAMRLPRPR